MSAGYHECHRCKGNLVPGCEGCRPRAGNVPLHPLTQSLESNLTLVLIRMSIETQLIAPQIQAA